jgi:uncharacterized protein GlcG (DUF336 family)
MHINLEDAEKAIAAARKKAISLKTQMCIAVVDSGANLKAFHERSFLKPASLPRSG